jgi:hypothetical protein
VCNTHPHTVSDRIGQFVCARVVPAQVQNLRDGMPQSGQSLQLLARIDTQCILPQVVM